MNPQRRRGAPKGSANAKKDVTKQARINDLRIEQKDFDAMTGVMSDFESRPAFVRAAIKREIAWRLANLREHGQDATGK